MEELPICISCIHCSKIQLHGRVRRLDCKDNPNLGAVSDHYAKCPGYKKVSRYVNNLHDNSTARQDPEARMERDHQEA